MKRVILAVIAWAVATSTFAQRASSTSTSFFSTDRGDTKVTFGLRGGLNLSRFHFSEDYEGIKIQPGFHIGAVVDVPFIESLAFQTGLYFTQKGYKQTLKNVNSVGDKYTGKVHPGYIEMPLLISYRAIFSDNARLHINTGPYWAVGICGKARVTERDAYGHTYKDKGDVFGDDYDDMNLQRFDLGWQIGAGLEISHIYFGYTFEAGFLNMLDSSSQTWRTRNHMISVGYNF